MRAGRSLRAGPSRDVAIGVRAKDAERINDRLGYGMRVEVSDRILVPVHETVSGVLNAVLSRRDGYLGERAVRPHAGRNVRLAVYHLQRHAAGEGITDRLEQGLMLNVNGRTALNPQEEILLIKRALREALWRSIGKDTPR